MVPRLERPKRIADLAAVRAEEADDGNAAHAGIARGRALAN
jgi:hypothetical protein